MRAPSPFAVILCIKPRRGYESLRRFRTTIAGASYFVTLCTRNRLSGLNEDPIATAIVSELLSMEADGAVAPRAWVIMPDHLHCLMQTTSRLSLSQVIGRIKSKTRRALEARNSMWQGNYYEHRLRPDDPIAEVLRYIFLNPYRAGLIPQTATYPHYWIRTEERDWFSATIDDNRPFPEWLT